MEPVSKKTITALYQWYYKTKIASLMGYSLFDGTQHEVNKHKKGIEKME